MKLIDTIVQQAAAITEFRRDIHAHPELCFEEIRTAERIATQLEAWNIPTHRGLAKTGVVGVIQSGNSQRAIGLRADMDALPLQELNQFAHASKHPGKMHACGHDGHIAMLLAAAQHLAQHRQFDGTVYVIFQPAEEGGGGAKVMLEEGLLERFPMEAIFGLHNWPGMPVGTFAISPGPVMASSNEFNITVRGKGCHAAMPHLGIDPIPIACQIVQGFQTIISRNLRPIDAGVISVTTLHAGQASNIIADTCEIGGTVRTFTVEALDLIEHRMRQTAEQICAAFGAQCEFTFERNYPPTINHPDMSTLARQVMQDIVGNEKIQTQEPTMGAEDFAYMLQARPGCYAFIDNGLGQHRSNQHGAGPCTLHNPSYDFNDELIALGATYWVRLAEAALFHF